MMTCLHRVSSCPAAPVRPTSAGSSTCGPRRSLTVARWPFRSAALRAHGVRLIVDNRGGSHLFLYSAAFSPSSAFEVPTTSTEQTAIAASLYVRLSSGALPLYGLDRSSSVTDHLHPPYFFPEKSAAPVHKITGLGTVIEMLPSYVGFAVLPLLSSILLFTSPAATAALEVRQSGPSSTPCPQNFVCPTPVPYPWVPDTGEVPPSDQCEFVIYRVSEKGSHLRARI